MPPLIALLRPKQWTKGLLVFAALFFTAKFKDAGAVAIAFQAFFAIALVSSAVYIFNDARDVERDRAHPKKKTRPLASGAVTLPIAYVAMAVCLAAGFGLAIAINDRVVVVLVAYLALQLVYNFGLKAVPVADVFLIASGFVLRAALGAAALDVRISGWLLLCTGSLALMLGFGKRRHEFILQGNERATSRESLAGYTKPALDAMLIAAATGAALCYGIYSIESSTARSHPALISTSIWVTYGIFRYIFLVLSQDEGGEPENLLFKDRHILFTIFAFAINVVLAMSGVDLPIVENGSSL